MRRKCCSVLKWQHVWKVRRGHFWRELSCRDFSKLLVWPINLNWPKKTQIGTQILLSICTFHLFLAKLWFLTIILKSEGKISGCKNGENKILRRCSEGKTQLITEWGHSETWHPNMYIMLNVTIHLETTLQTCYYIFTCYNIFDSIYSLWTVRKVRKTFLLLHAHAVSVHLYSICYICLLSMKKVHIKLVLMFCSSGYCRIRPEDFCLPGACSQ